MADVIISDEYIAAIGKVYEDECALIQKTLSSYIKILKTVREAGIMEGETSEALGAFLELAKELLNKWDKENTGMAAKAIADICMQKLDEVDEGLYGG